MIRFNNDYNRSAHPAVLEALMKSSGESYGGYGLDFWCEKAAEEIGKYIGTAEADIHFLVGGTQANFTVITAALRSYQSVISADTGHIQGHETGAVENTGHKIIALPSADPIPFYIYNIGNSAPVELMDFISVIEKTAGKTAIKQMMGMQPGDVVCTYADTGRLEKDFGYKPSTSIEEGIQKFYDWYVGYFNK